MEKKKMSIAAMGIVVALVAAMSATVSPLMSATVSPLMSDTPLFTLRMEQASSKMSFLPTAVNDFTYNTENGYTLNSCATGYCGGAVLRGTDATCFHTCMGETCETCYSTCPDTCWSTCPNTCPNTCSATCPNTCFSTCPITCDDATCPQTCNTCSGQTCEGGSTCDQTSCGPTCINTCGVTCRFTCEDTACDPCPP
ncbi:MAG: hypothetical protein WBA22_19015 [Candidatus Methanofastidiosia archaeon]